MYSNFLELVHLDIETAIDYSTKQDIKLVYLDRKTLNYKDIMDSKT